MSNQPSPQPANNERIIKVKPVQIQQKDTHTITGKQDLSAHEKKTLVYRELENAQIELDNFKEKKRQMLKATAEEIKMQKDSWEDEKVSLMKQAHEEGYQEGYQKGEIEGLGQYNEKVEQLNNLVKTTTKDYHKTLEKSDQVIVDLSIHIAEKIIKEKIADHPNHYLTIVNDAIQEIKDQSIISIYSHPNDYEILMKQKEELMNAVDGDTKISIFIDPNMSESNCMIEHQFGQIDASIDTQLEQIREALYQVGMENKS